MKNVLQRTAIPVALFFSIYCQAQTDLWVKKGTGEGFDNGNGIASDDSGNVYVTGQIEFVSTFGSYVLPTQGSHDIVVGRYSSDGNLQWIHSAGGKGGDVGHSIGCDAQHNTYVVGEMEDTVNFGGIKVISGGANDAFFAKYDVNGNIIWVKNFGNAGNDKGLGLFVTSSGDCYLTGFFAGSINFGGTVLNSSGGADIYIVKTNSSGIIQWAKKAGGPGEDKGYGIALDAAGNVYVTGSFASSASFSSTTLTGLGNINTFLAKYNSSGSLQWAKSAGACCDTTKAKGISIDENGNVYIAGYFKGVTKFGSIQLNSPGTADADIFITKYDPTGNVLWAKRGGGANDDYAEGLKVDNVSHTVYVTGSVESTGSFDSKAYSIAGFMDIFVTAYDLNGNAMWVKTNGGHLRDIGSAITVDPAGYIYTTGLFNDVANFDNITMTGYPDQPWADFYVDKIKPPLAAPATNGASALAATAAVCSDLKLSFIPGNGSGRIIIARKGSVVNEFPVNGTNYLADNTFGNGSDLGNGNFVVYSGNDNNCNVTGLTAGEAYYFSVFEFTGAGLTQNYLTTSFASTSITAPSFSINVSGLQNSICRGDSIVLHATEANTFSWSPSSSLSSDNGATVTATPATTTTYFVNGVTSAGCNAKSTFTIVVNELPIISLAGITPVCENAMPVTLNSGMPAGGNYSGVGVTMNQFDPVISGVGISVINYLYTDANGCSNVAQASVIVNPLPVITMNAIPDLCRNGSPLTLNNASPAGGTYSGPGVTNGVFNPSTGTGSFPITYNYTDINGCTSSAVTNAVVQPAPSVNLGSSRIVCADQTATLNAGNGFSGYSWSTGATTPSITIDSSGTGIGSTNVFVIVTNSFGCRNSSTVQVRFDICSGINEQDKNIDGILIYPNPFHNTFTVQSEKNTSFSLYDICGRQLGSFNNGTGEIEIGENLSAGLYFLNVKSGSTNRVYSILKTE